MNDKVKKLLYGLLSVSSLALFVVVWVVLSHAEGTMLPTPTATFSRFIDIMQNPISKATLPVHIWVSLRRVLIAFLFAVVIGIALGVGLGWSEKFNAFFGPLFEMIRPIPPIAWIPMIIIWFGIGETAKIVIVFIGAFTSIVLNTSAGIRAIDRCSSAPARCSARTGASCSSTWPCPRPSPRSSRASGRRFQAAGCAWWPPR